MSDPKRNALREVLSNMLLALLPLPKLNSWRSAITSPTVSKIAKVTEKFNWLSIFKPIGDILGFAFGGLGSFLSWSAVNVARMLIGTVKFAWTFDWNTTDETLNAQFAAARLAWYEQFGETIGESLGWIVCGLVPAATVVYFNKPLGMKILMDVGEEAYDEIAASLGALLQITVRQKMNEYAKRAFMALRWYIKQANKGYADPFTVAAVTGLKLVFPGLNNAITQWGEKGGKPWILANKVEEWVENSPLPQEWKNFLEGLIEGFGDTCEEALLCFANSFDEQIAQMSVEKQIEQQPNTVVVQPNRLAPDERLIFHGTIQQLKADITLGMNNYQIVANKNVGYDLGMPLIDRAHKQISEYVIVLYLKSKQKPPYGVGTKQIQITLNSADPLKFTNYSKVILALGGGGEGNLTGYMYGNFVCTGQMSDGSLLRAFADSRDNAILRVEAVQELGTATIETINVTEEIKDYQRQKVDGLYKDAVRVYPWKIEVVRKTKVYNDYDLSNKLLPGATRPTRKGYYNHSEPYTLELWQGKEPSDWSSKMTELTAPITVPTVP